MNLHPKVVKEDGGRSVDVISPSKNLLEYTVLSTCDSIFEDAHSNRMYYICPDDGKEYIMTDECVHVYFYDVLNDSFIKKFEFKYDEYEQIMDLSCYKMCLNSKDNSVYLFAGRFIRVLNLSTSRLITKRNNITRLSDCTI